MDPLVNANMPSILTQYIRIRMCKCKIIEYKITGNFDRIISMENI